jgi:Flp pilus assembly protein TadG
VRERERGAIAVLMAMSLTILLGFAALGFDLSYVRLGRLQMENATDAAAHAAMIVLRGTNDTAQAKDAAIDIAHRHEVLGQPMKLTSSDIVFGAYNFTTKTFSSGTQPYNAVRINSQRFSSDTGGGLVNLTFGRALGYTEADVTQTVTGAFINRYFQVEFDVTDSYLCDVDKGSDAAVTLLKYLCPVSYGGGCLGKGTPGDWIGLDVFTGNPQQLNAMKNIAWKYNEILNGTGLNDGWLRDASTLAGQTKGIGVCNKSDDAVGSRCYNGTSWDMTTAVAAGGWRQCPSGGATQPCASQFPFPNHNWMPACDSRKASLAALGLWAGTDLAEAIRVGRNKLVAAHQAGEPMVLILFTDGSPMACTGVGGGGLCGTSSGNPYAGNWSPCCANGLTCGSAWVDSKGAAWGGGAFGDGSPNAGNSGLVPGPNPRAATATGGTACTAAKQMVADALTERDAAEAAGIDLFVVGLLSGKGATFANELHAGRGLTWTFTDPTQIAGYLTQIPDQIPLSIVR